MINWRHLPLAVYYEHPEWFRPLFAELDRRSIQYVRIDAGCHGYDPTAADRNYALLVNRMSASAYLRSNVQGFSSRATTLRISRVLARVSSTAARPSRSRFQRRRNLRSCTRWDWLRRARVS